MTAPSLAARLAAPPALGRRRFGQGLGLLVAALTLHPAPLSAAPQDAIPASLRKTKSLDGWIRIDRGGTVTVCTGKVELGQGILTALAQIAADGLDVELSRIRMVSGDTTLTPDEGQTSGSMSVEQSGQAIRYAAAEARSLLVGAAAAKAGLPAGRLTVTDGTVRDPASPWQTTYWALDEADLLHRDATAAVPPKPPAQYRYIGKPVPRLDIPGKVTGVASYVQDMRPPGMVHGRAIRPPRMGATLVSVDDAAVRAMPGVLAVVRDGSFLGVVTEREEQAVAARAALRDAAVWEGGTPLPDAADLPGFLRAQPGNATPIGRKPAAGAPSAADAPPPADTPPVVKQLSATWSRPFVAHAAIGPSCSLAVLEGDGLHVWSHSQSVFGLRINLGRVLGMALDRIVVSHAQGSGCYGHNGADDVALDAAILARAVPGRPVRTVWMRDDEFAWEPYGSAMAMRARAGLSAAGRIVEWEYEVWSGTHSARPGESRSGGPDGNNLLAGWYTAQPQAPAEPYQHPQPNGGGDRNAVPLYDFARQNIVYHFLPSVVLRASALRTLGAFSNVFAIESFMDELAGAAGQDPAAFRLAHLTDDRAKAVIAAAAELAGPRRPGFGRGTAFARYKNQMSYVAVVLDLQVDKGSGAVRVHRVACAVDAGEAINPDGLRNQVEGGIIQAISWTLKERVRFDRTRITSRDWASYPILTFAEVPDIAVRVLDRPGMPPLGAGECSLGPTGAAVANAIHDAAGVRLRDLPLTPDKVRTALAEKAGRA